MAESATSIYRINLEVGISVLEGLTIREKIITPIPLSSIQISVKQVLGDRIIRKNRRTILQRPGPDQLDSTFDIVKFQQLQEIVLCDYHQHSSFLNILVKEEFLEFEF